MDYLIPGPNLGRLSIVLLASVVIIQTVAAARRVAVTSFAAGLPGFQPDHRRDGRQRRQGLGAGDGARDESRRVHRAAQRQVF